MLCSGCIIGVTHKTLANRRANLLGVLTWFAGRYAVRLRCAAFAGERKHFVAVWSTDASAAA
jgi:hypothetical protein